MPGPTFPTSILISNINKRSHLQRQQKTHLKSHYLRCHKQFFQINLSVDRKTLLKCGRHVCCCKIHYTLYIHKDSKFKSRKEIHSHRTHRNISGTTKKNTHPAWQRSKLWQIAQRTSTFFSSLIFHISPPFTINQNTHTNARTHF